MAFYFEVDDAQQGLDPFIAYTQKQIIDWRLVAAAVMLLMATTLSVLTIKAYAEVRPPAEEVVESTASLLPVAPAPAPQVAAAVVAPDRSPELSTELEAWAANQKGQWGFYVKSLDDDSLNVGIGSDAQFDMASIYKLHVIQPLAKKVPAEAWATNTIIGKSYLDCVNRMLTYSDNPCAEAFGNLVGWNNMHKNARALGYNQTVLNDSTNFVSSAGDTGRLLESLWENNGYAAKTKEIALAAMAKPKSAESIRLACQGCAVFNKTGFIADVKHDAAIVQKDGKTYVVVIFSKSSTWQQSAQAAGIIGSYL